ILAGVQCCQMPVEVIENLGGPLRRTGVGMGDTVSNRHQHCCRSAMPAHISNKNAPLASGERKKIVVIAARSLRGLIVSGEVKRGNRRQRVWEERPLNLTNGFQLP